MTASHSHGGYAALFQWILAPYHPPGLVHGRNGQAWLAPKKISLPDPEITSPIQNGWVEVGRVEREFSQRNSNRNLQLKEQKRGVI